MTDTIQPCMFCDGESKHSEHYICPRCEKTHFRHHGYHTVDNTSIFLMSCRDCGLTFAVEEEPYNTDD